MSDPLDRNAHELQTQGYTIVHNVLTLDEVEAVRGALREIFEREKEIGRKRNWHTDMHRVAYMLPQKHALFREIPLNPRVLPLMQKVLGSDCVLSSINGMTMSEGGKAQPLHLDQPQSVPGIVLNINALYTLDDFTRANGCTRVVPFSQDRVVKQPIDQEAEEKNTIYLEAPVGSLIAFNGGIIHAGSANTTTGLRRCLHAYYCRAWVRPQWDYPSSLTSDVVATLNDQQRRLFGFHPTEWRYDVATDAQTRTVRVSQ
jgi:ectoine hydroxylase-related dioxygenase (phytanoyl-CoA dioxygenase family)